MRNSCVFPRRLRARTVTLAAVLLVVALPLTSIDATSAVAQAKHVKQAKEALTALPDQRSGSAAGLSHEAGANKNNIIPPSYRSRYPLVQFKAAPKATNNAHVVKTVRKPVSGFNPKTSVEIPSRRTSNASTYANSDGTETTVYSGAPTNYQDGAGHWQPIKPALTSEPGDRGRLTATGGAAAVQLADQLNTNSNLATVTLDADHAISWGVASASSPSAQVHGNSARYPGFAHDADLDVAATATGVKETIVLRSAQAPTSYTFPLQLKGITAALAGRQVDLTDAGGALRATIPAGFMTDAAGVRSDAVSYQLAGNRLTVSIDRAWLSDPARVFPISVDPTVQTNKSVSVLAVSGSTATATSADVALGPGKSVYLKWDLSALANETIFGAQLSVVTYGAASCKARPVTVYPVTGTFAAGSAPSYSSKALASQSFAYGYVPPEGAHDTACPVKATLFNLGNDGVDLVQRWVNNASTNNGLTLRTGSDSLSAKTLAGSASANKPTLYVTHTPYNAGYAIPNPNPTPPVLLTTGGNVKVTVTNTSAMTWTAAGYYLGYRMYDSKGNPAVDNTGKAIGLVKAASLPADLARNGRVTLTAAVTSPHVKGVYTLDFSMVKSAGPVVFTDEQVPPGRIVLQVFDLPPVITGAYPQNGYQAPTLTPQLWAQGKDVDALSGSTLTYNYKVCPGTDTTSTACFSSGFSSSPGWVVPAGKLSWGKSYTWIGQVKDTSTTVSTPNITLLTSVPQPAVVSDLAGAPYSSQDKEFDPLAGNYSTGAIDATVSTTGPDLGVARTYNSLDPRTDAAFGAGWSSTYDMKVTAESDGSGNMLVRLPSGQQVRFGKNPDGTWTGPASQQATFTLSNGTYVLHDQGGSTYTFSLSGKLQQILGPWGKPVTLNYDGSGNLATAKSGDSGRTITFTWAGGHVATAATPTVNGVTPTWHYSYTGDTLSSVCAPDNSCTTYAQVADSHYKTAVMDAKPDSYWRFGESTGTDAGSEVAVNLGKDAGSYVGGATVGGTGAIAGVSDTSVALSGSSQYVKLPTGTAKKSRDMAVELWFKTASSGPLFGYQEKDLSAASANGVPLLYVGTDGKLRGQYRTGTISPITSATTVNNNAWHHVVLSAMGNTQTLFLDGVSVGTLTGTIDHANLTYSQLGAAYATGSWAGYPTGALHYFTGSIDEAAVYSHPLGADVVAAHYKLGTTTSNVISQVTLPSGKIASAVSYDAANDRVSEYTDKQGGTWRVGAPLVTGDDKDMRRTIMVSDPAGRPYLYEFDAITGTILRAGTPSGQTVRTEDQNCATTPTPADPEFCAIEGTSGASQIIDFSGMFIRTYQYNDDGSLNTVTDENGDPTYMTYDAHGNVLTKKSCRTSATDCATTYYTYPSGLTDPLDPRWDKPLTMRDGRSASVTDNNYLTQYTYDSKGDLQNQTNPDGGAVKTVYSTGTEAAYDSGTIPSGLPMSSTDALNHVTKLSYFSNGDLAQITEPSGLITRFGYDALGRKISQTEVSDSYPAGVTTTFGYDAESRLISTTGPATTDAVNGIHHQQQVNQTYDADGNVTKTEVKDLLGGDATRTTTYTFDDHNRVISAVNPNGDEVSYDYDKFGNKIAMTDAVGNQYVYAYTARNAIAEVRLRDPNSTDNATDPNANHSYLVLTSYAYDPSGRLAYQTDAMGHRIRYEYYHDDLVHRKVQENFHNPDGSTREYVLEDDSYDAAGNLTRQAAGNGTSVTTFTRDNMGRVKTSVLGGTVSRTTSYTYDLDGNTTKVVATGASSNLPWFNPVQTQTTTYAYDSSDRPTTETVDLGGTSMVTTTQYDQRGNVTGIVDPLGNVAGATAANYTTNYSYDELSRQVGTIMPPISTEVNGGSPVTQRPQATNGYDSFNEVVATKNPTGDIATNTYDTVGNVVKRTLPSYTPPGSSTPIVPTSTASYDGDGQLVSSIDTRGFTTRYSYDRLGDLTTLDEPNSSDTDRAVTSYTYSHTGQLLSTTNPNGAVSQQTFDDLDRPVTATQVERYPSLQNYVSKYSYDDNGNVTSAVSPSGAATTSSYDGLGQLTQVTDPNGVVTQYGYDGMGNQTRLSDGLGRTSKSVYDLGGRLTSDSDLDSSLNPIRTQSYTYDVDGNLLTSTPGNGHATSFSYDNVGQLVKQVDPVTDTKSITTSFGYDVSGDRTRYTDGRGNSTIFTFNSLGLPESVIEPSTTAQPAAADRTWTASYDAASEPVTMTAPGNVVRQRTYDAAGRLTVESGSGAESTTGTKRIGYDVLGRVTSVGAAGGTDTYTYNDRDLRLTAAGPSGTASYTYNADSQISQRTDVSGTANYTYSNGRLAAETDPVAGTTETVSYDASGAPSTLDYGAGRVRSFTYDSLGRLSTDVLKNGGGNTVDSVSYGYDLNNNITSKTTAGVQGSGANSYTFDYLDRMTSWTNPSNVTTNYGWDDSSNRIQNGSKTATYDERNRLLSDGTSTYTYTARGSLKTKKTGTTTENFSFDAFDRLITDGSQSYSYDDLDRLTSDSGKTLKYAGTDPGVISDGTSTYGRDADGQVTSEQTGTTKRSLISDQHGDVIGGFDPSDTTLSALADSKSYDPWGNVTASSSSNALASVGYQGSWTDTDTGQVDMGTRWYSPTTGSFDSQDSTQYASGASSLANKYLYGAGNPITYNDPDGNWPHCGWCHKAVHAVTHTVSNVVHSVSHAVSSAYNTVTNWASDAWEFAKKAAAAVVNFAKAAYHAVSNAVSWVYNKAKSAVKTVWHAVSTATNWVAEKAAAAAHWAAQKAQEAAAAAHRAAVAVSTATKAAIHYAVEHNPIPAIEAAVKPLINAAKKVVSAVASIPAAIVAVTVNVVKQAAAAVQVVYQAAVTAAGAVVQAVSAAVQATTTFVQDHWKTIAAIAAGAATFLGCEALTMGAGSAGCVIAAAAVGGAVANALNCPPGQSVAGCAVKGAVAGAIGGAVTVATGGAGGILVASLSAAGGAAAENASLQYLNTGHVDAGQVAESAVIGGVTGGAGAAASRIKGGAAAEEEGGATSCSLNSFIGSTPVLMADGSQKPIDQVHKGDSVLATDPETGVTSAETVIEPLAHGGQQTMVEVELSDGSEVISTDHHAFWDDTTGTFVNAINLSKGDRVLTAAGKRLFIKATVVFAAVLMVFNLHVANIHTYYAGATPVLVHNTCPTYRGGRYKDLDAPAGVERNHMPANAISPLSKRQGPAIQMDKADHMQTSSWGSSSSAKAYRAAQKDLMDQGRPSDAVQMDIDDIQTRFGSKYDGAILQMIDSLPEGW